MMWSPKNLTKHNVPSKHVICLINQWGSFFRIDDAKYHTGPTTYNELYKTT